MTSRLTVLLRAPDREALNELLAEEVQFHSPVADYRGRVDVSHLLSLIAIIVQDLQPTRELEDGASKVTFFHGVVEGQPVQGVLDEHYDENEQLVDATLMLRPLAALQRAIGAMAAALDAAPLPSAS